MPVGTTVDTLKGRVTLVAAADKQGKTATADFYDGDLQDQPVQGQQADHDADPDREAHLPEEGRQRDRGGQEEEAPAVG